LKGEERNFSRGKEGIGAGLREEKSLTILSQNMNVRDGHRFTRKGGRLVEAKDGREKGLGMQREKRADGSYGRSGKKSARNPSINADEKGISATGTAEKMVFPERKKGSRPDPTDEENRVDPVRREKSAQNN